MMVFVEIWRAPKECYMVLSSALPSNLRALGRGGGGALQQQEQQKNSKSLYTR